MEPALDLGVVAAMVSSFKNQALDPKMVIFGEVGLSGEVRGVSMAEQRMLEAKKLGFTSCVMPMSNYENLKQHKTDGMKLYGVANLSEMINILLG